MGLLKNRPMDEPDCEGLGSMIGRSAAMRTVFERTLRIAASDSTVLITGESGTGKELIARTIHDRSRRAGQPFVAVTVEPYPRISLRTNWSGMSEEHSPAHNNLDQDGHTPRKEPYFWTR